MASVSHSRSRSAFRNVSSILPNKMEASALLSHPLALASKLMSSLQHYTVQTLIPSQPPRATHLPLCSVASLLVLRSLLGLLSKPALNHTSAHDVADDGEERGLVKSKTGNARGGRVSRILVTIARMRGQTLTGFRRIHRRIIRRNYYKALENAKHALHFVYYCW